MKCELLSIIKSSEPLQCTSFELHSCYSVVTECVVQQLKLNAILEIVHRIAALLKLLLRRPSFTPILDQGKMGLCCCSCYSLASLWGRESPEGVSILLFYPFRKPKSELQQENKEIRDLLAISLQGAQKR